MTAPVITVFGATGGQGGGLARAILADPGRRFAVRAVTRKPDSPAARALATAGAEVARADMNDRASVMRAMEGAHGAFCVTDFWEHGSPDTELANARTMAIAAAAAGVAHVIWSTLEDTREFVAPGAAMPVLLGRYNVPHYDAKGEANHAFTDAEVPTTLLVTSFQWDDLLHFAMQPKRNRDGKLAFLLPTGNARLPGIAAEDIGACALAIFARGDDLVGKSIGIAGEHLSGAQMAEQLTLALGEPVEHVDPSPDEYRALGFPGAAELANLFQFTRDFERSYCAARSVACSRALYPKLATFAGWLARNKSRIPVH